MCESGRPLKLGPIYAYWINEHIRPCDSEVIAVSDALLFLRTVYSVAPVRPIVSVGADDCFYEIVLNKKLLEMGETILSLRRLSYCLLEFEAGRDRVLVKHANRIEREFLEVFASEFD